WWDTALPDGSHHPHESALAFVAIIGVVEVVDCVRLAAVRDNPWADGPWCWLLANPRPLAAPVFCRGFQKLWTPSRRLPGHVQDQLAPGRRTASCPLTTCPRA